MSQEDWSVFGVSVKKNQSHQSIAKLQTTTNRSLVGHGKKTGNLSFWLRESYSLLYKHWSSLSIPPSPHKEKEQGVHMD